MTQQPAPSRAGSRPRLRELDLVRVLTFACVIAVHVISRTSRGDIPMVGVLILVHFTREVFFALSGWVLVYSWLARPQPMRRFWPRRFLLVGIPYITWSAIYVLLDWVQHPTPVLRLLGDLGWALLTGTAYYHLYFLLVTMQIYLLFPLLIRLVVATRGRHAVVLAVAFALQLTTSAIDAYAPGTLAAINAVSNVLNYQAFIIGGAIAADHADAVLSRVRAHRRPIAFVTALAALVTLAVYALQLTLGFDAYRAATAYQPIVIVWSAVIGVGLLALGTWWVDRRGPGARYSVLDYLSDRSFGVFLAHPLVLWAVLAVAGSAVAAWPVSVVALVDWIVVAAGALAIADLARRSPLSLPLAGRPWTRPGGRERRSRAAARR